MAKLSNATVKKIFSHQSVHIPPEIKDLELELFSYISWIDQREDAIFMIYKFHGKLEGIRWRWYRFGLRPYIFVTCDICKKHRKRDEILSVSSTTRTLPLGVTYFSKAFHICADFYQCNLDMKNEEGIQRIYKAILN